jgi:hypothetical protein
MGLDAPPVYRSAPMIEIQELVGGRPASRLLNVEAIQEVAAEGERTRILMRDGSQHVVEIPYRAFRSRLGLVLNRMLPLEANV